MKLFNRDLLIHYNHGLIINRGLLIYNVHILIVILYHRFVCN
jgi:hypothetical protein